MILARGPQTSFGKLVFVCNLCVHSLYAIFVCNLCMHSLYAVFVCNLRYLRYLGGTSKTS